MIYKLNYQDMIEENNLKVSNDKSQSFPTKV